MPQPANQRSFPLLYCLFLDFPIYRRPVFSPSPMPASKTNLRSRSAFTLLELLVVVGVIVLLMLFLAPAFTSLKRANDITNAAHTIKEALEQARNTARASNTYCWAGFYEEDGSKDSTNPPSPGNGRLIISMVASKDGTTIYGSSAGAIDPTKLRQIGKLIKLEAVHLPLFAVGSGTGSTFDTRPIPDWNSFTDYNSSRFGELNASPPNTAPRSSTNSATQYPFQYPVGSPAPAPQYTFYRTLQFAPAGDCRIFSTYDVRRVIEIGLIATHGNATPIPTSGAGTSSVTFDGNVIALQVTGFGGNVKIYTR